jgi:hypothetical protein
MAQLINEVKRMQQLAGLLNENLTPEEIEREAFNKIANSSEFNRAMETAWEKLSDEDIAKLTQSLSLNEGTGGDFSSFSRMVDKVEKVISEDLSDVKAKVGNAIGTVGQINSLAFGIPAGVALNKLGVITGAMSQGPAMAASLIGGMILWWLGKKIAGDKVSKSLNEKDIESAVNEALAKIRKK